MPSPMMWLGAAIVMLLVAMGAGVYWKNHKDTDPESPKTSAAAKGWKVALVTALIMFAGFFWSRRRAAVEAAEAASGEKIPLSPNASEAEKAAAVAEQQYRIAAGKLAEQAAVLNSKATTAANIREKAANLRGKFTPPLK